MNRTTVAAPVQSTATVATVPAGMTAAAMATWVAYVMVMDTARVVSLALADALERYLRKDTFATFDAACNAADRYRGAMLEAQPYHFGVMPIFHSGFVINDTPEQLLAMMRELRGSEKPLVIVQGNRAWSAMHYADNGIAGYFAGEVKAMTRFGSPRRTVSNMVALAA